MIPGHLGKPLHHYFYTNSDLLLGNVSKLSVPFHVRNHQSVESCQNYLLIFSIYYPIAFYDLISF